MNAMTHPTPIRGDYIGAVSQFVKVFDASTDPNLWLKLVAEETNELLDSIREDDKENALKEAADLAYVLAGFMYQTAELTPEEQEALDHYDVHALLLDASEAAAAFRVAYPDIDIPTMQEAFHRVHMSNMSKLDDEGLPIKREDGKIMKGPNYREPDLSDLIA